VAVLSLLVVLWVLILMFCFTSSTGGMRRYSCTTWVFSYSFIPVAVIHYSSSVKVWWTFWGSGAHIRLSVTWGRGFDSRIVQIFVSMNGLCWVWMFSMYDMCIYKKSLCRSLSVILSYFKIVWHRRHPILCILCYGILCLCNLRFFWLTNIFDIHRFSSE
jgi:hypothetical protein